MSVACASSATPPGAAPARPDSPATPRADAGPHFYEAEEVDVAARPVDPIEPDYPPALRALGLEGEVEARVAVLPDGSVGGARLVSSSDDAFTAAAREAIASARFHPARVRGRAVPSWITLHLRFRLAD